MYRKLQNLIRIAVSVPVHALVDVNFNEYLRIQFVRVIRTLACTSRSGYREALSSIHKNYRDACARLDS